MLFQEMIRAGLRQTGLTQQDAARKAGKNADWLKTLLKENPSEPRTAGLVRLCRALKINQLEFFAAVEEAFPPPGDREAQENALIAERLRDIPREEKADIMRRLGLKS